MDTNLDTEKAQDALQNAQKGAVRADNQQVDVEHLLAAFLDDNKGLVPAILRKADINVDGLREKAEAELERLPRVSGSSGPDQFYLTGRLNRLLTQAEDELKQFKDEYISVEHLLLAMTEDGGAARLL